MLSSSYKNHSNNHNHNYDYNNNNNNKRLVLFVGPHKSASTSIQNFFIEQTANYHGKPRHPAFANWTWPFSPFAKHPGAFGDLVTNFVRQGQIYHDTRRAELYFTASFVWQHSREGIILGHEELDRMGPTPFSNRDGLQAIRNLLQLLQPPQLDVVVNYRAPRSDHWISVWKQLAPNRTYSKFVCRISKPWEYLNSVANPLQIASYILHERIRNVTLIDMSGVADAQLDISHVIACRILRVECLDGWVKGLEHTVWRSNARSLDPQLDDSQINELEWVLQQRDCAYRDELEPYIEEGSLALLHRHLLWKDCDKFSYETQKSFRNTSYVLELLQSQVGCGPLASNASQRTTYISDMMQRSRAMHNNQTSAGTVPSRIKGQEKPSSMMRHTTKYQILPNQTRPILPLLPQRIDSHLSLDYLMGLAMIQHVLLLFAILVVLLKLKKRIRRRLRCC